MNATPRAIAIAMICATAFLPIPAVAASDQACMIWSSNWTGYYQEPESLCEIHLPANFTKALGETSQLGVFTSLAIESETAAFYEENLNGTCVQVYWGDLSNGQCETTAKAAEDALANMQKTTAPFHAALLKESEDVAKQVEAMMSDHRDLLEQIEMQASAVQQALPMEFGNGIEWAAIAAGPGLAMKFDYRYLVPTKEAMDDAHKFVMKRLAVSGICKSDEFGFLAKGVTYYINYTRKNGDRLVQFRINQSDCEK